jgi:PAS domain S-box-containing protein
MHMMNDIDKTKKQLIQELVDARQQIGELNAAETERKQAEATLRLQGEIATNMPDGVYLSQADAEVIVKRTRTKTQLQKLTHDLGERVKELNCLYSISRLVEQPGTSLEDILQGTVDLIPPSWQYSTITCARITLKDKTFSTDNFEKTIWKQSGDILVKGEKVGTLDICYLEEMPEADSGAFLKEEQALLAAIVEQLGRIIEHKQMEGTLRESEKRYRSLFDSVPIGLYRTSLDGRFIDVNLSFVDILGYADRESVLAANAADNYIDPATREAWKESLARNGVVSGYLLQIRKQDGTPIWIETSARVIQGPEGAIYEGVVQDVTARKMMEEAQQESETRYRNMFEKQKAIMLLIDPQSGVIVDANNAACDFYGYSHDQLTAMNISDINMLSESEVQAEMERARSEQRDYFIFRHQLASGEIRDVEGRSVPIEHRGRVLLYSIIHDITERKRVEDELLESERRHRMIAEMISDFAYSYRVQADGTWKYDWATKAALTRVAGYTVEEIGNSLNLYHPDEVERVDNDLNRVIAGETVTGEYRIFMKNGEPGWVRVHRQPIWDENKEKVVGFYGATSDITKEKQADQALKESEAQYRSLFENSPVSLWEEDYSEVKSYIDNLLESGVTDLKAYFDTHPEVVTHCASLVKILRVNQATLDLYKVESEEDIPASLDQYFTKESHESFKEELIALAGGSTTFAHDNIGQPIANGGEQLHLTIALSIAPGFEDTWARVFVSVLDISAQKQAEQQRLALALEKERVQILTRFITQASHEFRTPLSNINTQAYLLTRLAEPDKKEQYLRQIEAQVKIISELVDELTTMTRLDSSDHWMMSRVDLNQVLQDASQSAMTDAPEEHPDMILKLSEKRLSLQGNPDYLKHAFKRILGNALRYTPADGTVTVRSTANDGALLIEISDTGIGISEKVLPRIFERFYRQDVAGKTRGIGLGLPIAKTIIERHKGRIEVESEEGKGSIFRIILPSA